MENREKLAIQCITILSLVLIAMILTLNVISTMKYLSDNEHVLKLVEQGASPLEANCALKRKETSICAALVAK